MPPTAVDPATDVLALAEAVQARLEETADVHTIATLPGIKISMVAAADHANPPKPPILMVVPYAEQPTRADAAYEDGPGQGVTSTVQIYHAVPTRNVRGGGDAIPMIRAMRAVVRRTLAGWMPDGACAPLRYIGGRMIDPRGYFPEGVSVWQDGYSISGWLTEEAEA